MMHKFTPKATIVEKYAPVEVAFDELGRRMRVVLSMMKVKN